MGAIFLYDVEFTREANPPHRKDAFEESLKTFLRAAGLRYLMGALGGSLHTYGAVWREAGDASQGDREAVAGFIRRQPIRATARVGDLEAESATTDYLREITEWVFEVDGLTEGDRAEAASWHGRNRERGRPAGERHAEPGTAPDRGSRLQ